jgi:hypothetical protein
MTKIGQLSNDWECLGFAVVISTLLAKEIIEGSEPILQFLKRTQTDLLGHRISLFPNDASLLTNPPIVLKIRFMEYLFNTAMNELAGV